MKYSLFLISFTILLSACGEAIENLKIDKDLRARYQCEEVVTTVYNIKDKIKVRLINCKACNVGTDEKQQIADSIGKMILQYFPKLKLNEGVVAFEKRHNYIFATTNTSVDYDMHIGNADSVANDKK